ncbi:MAG: hypothetical protein WBF93_01515 [Pirellulales bacterium]
MAKSKYVNPFRPGAGHMPPYLAGRKSERNEFLRLLAQDIVLENMVLTGLRGVGKTVLLDTFKPNAMSAGWLWVGTDLSETTSLSESHICIRMLADLSVVTSSVTLDRHQEQRIGFGERSTVERKFDFGTMSALFSDTPGLSSDKLKAVLETAWEVLQPHSIRGIVFAYDEAQNMKDHAAKHQYPLSLMLDVFQSIQKKGIPFMLLLTGLPTLFPKLVEARTFSERMFHVVFLDRLDESESRDAIVKPVQKLPSQTQMNKESVELVIGDSGGYPYFIQFICREVYDVFLQSTGENLSVPIIDIKRKLDTDFFSGRWAKATDRQRELLTLVAHLPNCDTEFTIQAVSELSKQMLEKPFSNSQISNMFVKLGAAGLVYKNRHGKYSFAVPMLGEFIQRQGIAD